MNGTSVVKITDIKAQVKTPGRYSIFVDGKFSFGLSEGALLDAGVRVGQELSAPQLAELKQTAQNDKAYNRALGLLARRPRSEWEMRDYLKRKDYDQALIDATVTRLRDGGWLDDADFAKRWVENRRLLKSTSRRRLQQELKAKRVSDDIISMVLAEDDTDEKQVLQELILRKRKQSRYQEPDKLMAYLLRQGYNYGDIKDALTNLE